MISRFKPSGLEHKRSLRGGTYEIGRECVEILFFIYYPYIKRRSPLPSLKTAWRKE
jgi:hypothetical protein